MPGVSTLMGADDAHGLQLRNDAATGGVVNHRVIPERSPLLLPLDFIANVGQLPTDPVESILESHPGSLGILVGALDLHL